jgi:outer membrane protein, adhesin transport system
MKTKTQQIKLTGVAAALLVFGVQAQGQSFTEVVQNALAIYPSMLAAKAKTEAQRSDIDRARAAHMPQSAMAMRAASTPIPSCPHRFTPTRVHRQCV